MEIKGDMTDVKRKVGRDKGGKEKRRKRKNGLNII